MTATADKNPKYSTNPGKATQDRVWLLSIQEAEKHFSTDSARACKVTAYAKAQGTYTISSGACRWWLRSPGSRSNNAAVIDYDGSVYHYGIYTDCSILTVRPVVVVGLTDGCQSNQNRHGRRKLPC